MLTENDTIATDPFIAELEKRKGGGRVSVPQLSAI
jgi:hypothetical protein